jgi:hypothetical protein
MSRWTALSAYLALPACCSVTTAVWRRVPRSPDRACCVSFELPVHRHQLPRAARLRRARYGHGVRVVGATSRQASQAAALAFCDSGVVSWVSTAWAPSRAKTAPNSDASRARRTAAMRAASRGAAAIALIRWSTVPSGTIHAGGDASGRWRQARADCARPRVASLFPGPPKHHMPSLAPGCT